MKVLHIVGDSQYGGIVRIISGLARVGMASGWQVDVLTTDPAVQAVLRNQSLGIVNLDVIRRPIRPLWDFSGLLRLRKFLRHESYGIVHTHTSKGGVIGRLAAWLAGVPIIVHTMHGFAIHEQSPAWARVLYSAIERLASHWCHRIVSVSEFHRNWAVKLGICSPAHIQAIPNGITPATRSKSFKPAALRRQLGIRESDVFVLALARLAADKGLQHLIEAAAILPRDGLKYRIVIAGSGPARSGLERLVARRGVSEAVTFLGFREDVGELLAASDLVVLPSLREGLSISLLEAMAAGKPVIATSIGSHRELAAQAEMAVLVPPADPHALAGAIHRCAHDPGLMALLGSEARALFDAHYTEGRMLNAYRQLYLRLLDARTPRHRGSFGASIVRSAGTSDLAAIVAIHQKAFPQFFLTRMGSPFLRRYYELVLNYHSGIVLVSERNGSVNGFVCGFADPTEFYRLMWQNRFAFAFPAFAALVRHPSLAARVVNAVERVQTSSTRAPRLSCELSSIAVMPEAAGKGLGRTLLQAFLEQSWGKSAECVYLTTDADGNEAANALYREIGFQLSRRFLQKKGRWMNEYVVHHAQADEPLEIRA
jgi:glycosyltransferase involved in cell wall biosynthesis/ribosomal protein S18 acetylase RimI-like enzyme